MQLGLPSNSEGRRIKFTFFAFLNRAQGCCVFWIKSELILEKIRMRNFDFYRSGAAEFLPQTPSFRRALAWAGEFFVGVLIKS